jgi:heme/copper-type cytochrome/quinol oxidase subunit 1
MPPVTRRFLATAALSLVLGLSLGLWLLVRRELFGIWPTPHLTSAHAHLVLVGTVMQVIAGVALWMFPLPRRGAAPVHEPPWAMIGWWCLAPGTLVRAAAEVARATSAAGVLPLLVVGGGALQVLGMGAVVVALRHRIRPVGAGARAAL